MLRDGAMTAFAPRKDIDLEWIVRNMVGENFDLGSPPTGYEMGEVALKVENLTVPAPGGGYSVVDRLSLDVRAGEIVCIYGLMGAGRTEMMETRRRAPASPPAAASSSTAATSRASPSPSASPPASSSCRRTASATGWCRP